VSAHEKDADNRSECGAQCAGFRGHSSVFQVPGVGNA
jgi:hypothetical protein